MLAALLSLLFTTAAANAQIGTGFAFGGTPGVYLDVSGKVSTREVDQKDHLAAVRARAKAAVDAGKNEKLAYVSLPKLFAEVQSLRQAGKDIPEDLKYLGGITQLRYVLVFPDEKEIVIAGPAEPFVVMQGKDDAASFAVGKRTGRPVLQLDDLIVGLRTAREGRGALFGCGIYPSPNSMKIADDIAHRMAANTRAERMKALADGLGPQDVKIFGTRNDTRFGYICVAADYEMKRFALGMDRAPIANLGSAMDNSRSAISKFWFAADYEPLLVSKDGNAFEIRGQRLELQCGAFDFDPRGATETAKRWSEKFTKNMTGLAAAEPLFAELQNIADEALLGNLLLRDRLAEKAGWDNAFIYDDMAFPVAKVPVPKTADTLVSFTNGSLVAGGVTLNLYPLVDPKSRQTDDKGTLDAQKQAVANSRQSTSGSGAVAHAK
ncbi:MAG TPA: DUF1598 domain-containing protein [Tepidisphaeraceae bacterium]|jgi:hypothetical protein|nr:DUF1598 domain-containing protein [Tepidisphaeraceae bacterium]